MRKESHARSYHRLALSARSTLILLGMFMRIACLALAASHQGHTKIGEEGAICFCPFKAITPALNFIGGDNLGGKRLSFFFVEGVEKTHQWIAGDDNGE